MLELGMMNSKPTHGAIGNLVRGKKDSSVMETTTGRISKAELVFYVLMWTQGVLYSCYRVYESGQEHFSSLSSYDFEEGWDIIGRRKDISDYEWSVCSSLFVNLAPWFFLHIVVCNVIKKRLPQGILPWFVTLSSLVCLKFFVGMAGVALLILQALLMYAMHLARRKWLCWASSLAFLLCLNLGDYANLKELVVAPDSTEEYLLAVTIAWTNTRCLSFCLVCCDIRKDLPGNTIKRTFNDLLRLLAYCFYLPLLFTGPLMMFDDFDNQFYESVQEWTLHRVLTTFKAFLRYGFWFLFNEAVIHHVYFSALHYNSHLLDGLSLWSLCGLGYATSQFFMTKYTVMYGLPGAIAACEGVSAPPQPKCIGRIHLYSDMWRYFDQGLYTFLKRYIYVPIVCSSDATWRKMTAGALCFAFVYLWHGTSDNVLIWVVLNYVGVTIEWTARSISNMDSYRRIMVRWVSPVGLARIHAVLAAPLLMMSAISNFYFLCGSEVGHIFVRRMVLEAPTHALALVLFYLYCVCHVSVATKKWESPSSREGPRRKST